MRYRGGHLQIIASAGSGKTEVVSQRVADLLADGFPAESIVAFTFTERAADELTNRIVHRVEDRLGGAARKGAALLSGLVRCGRCGRMMQVGYSGHGGDTPRYVCGRGTQLYGTPPCQSIGGVHLH
ncbi:MAG TPA: UvrD-helicase domain-containing protein, partial [Streptosporangiaceae bacterium]|nr:UvrD-helicase domain-containing protein [Streptosporangiaceae bacterium]